jgi:C4-dicarboxylate transporter DctM subunit
VTATILVMLLVLFAILGAPLFTILLAVAMVGFYSQGIDLSVVAIEIYRIADMPLLLALPFFAFAGYVVGHSRTSERLVRLTQVFLGWMPGGLAIVSLVACALFTAFTGASGVTIVALGALLYPALMQDGYRERFSLGLVTSSGSLGLLFPPSVPSHSIRCGRPADGGRPGLHHRGFVLGGVAAGLLMLVLLAGWSLWTNRRMARQRQSFSISEALAAVRAAIWEIPLPIFLIVGIYSGYLAISEAAVMTAAYVVVVEVFIYREIPIKQLPAIMRESMVMVGGILLILGVSLAFTNYLIDAEVPMRLFTLIQRLVSDKVVFLVLLNLLLLMLGAILDIFSALVIMVPLILPVAVSYGVDPVHMGIIFLANMQIGYFTPPVGMNLFIASFRFEKPVAELYRATIPFMIVLLVAVLVITYLPQLSLFFL